MSENKEQNEIKEYADGWITERKGTEVPAFLKFAYIIIAGGCLTYLVIYMNGETGHAERGPLVQLLAIIALGAVIRGETYHFEVVSNDACRAVMEVQLDTGIPVANGILTCENDDQALARMQPKGTDCAQAAVEMANLLKALTDVR
jgi:hypothetical protein